MSLADQLKSVIIHFRLIGDSKLAADGDVSSVVYARGGLVCSLIGWLDGWINSCPDKVQTVLQHAESSRMPQDNKLICL